MSLPDDITITPTGAALGADIAGVDLSQSLSGVTFARILEAWHEHLVLRFRDQQMTDDDLLRFSRHFGELDMAPIPTDDGSNPSAYHEIAVISNVIVNGRPVGSLGSYESEWHTDMSYKDVTPSASILHGLEVPETGGDTVFANMYMAYEALPVGLKHAVEGQFCKHDASRNSAGELRRGFAEVTSPINVPGAVHPMVRTHPITGRAALFLGRRRNAYIMGMPLDESEDLLNQLWSHATRPEFCWDQKWRPRDVIVWDNRCVMHRRDSFAADARRVLHRTQIVGERPF